MNAELQRDLRFVLLRMNPEELKSLGFSLQRASEELLYNTQSYRETINAVSISLAAKM